MSRFRGMRFLVHAGFVLFLKIFCACSQTCTDASNATCRITYEYINAPVNLVVTLVSSQTYQLTFSSFDVQGGFSGFGIFTDPSYAVVNPSPDVQPASDPILAQAFCTLTSQACTTPVSIQVGPGAAGLATATSACDLPVHAICDITTYTLTSGNYVAIRARVERATNLWSKPVTAIIP